MPRAKGGQTSGAKPGAGMLELTAIDVLPPRAVRANWWIGTYQHRYTTRPFSLPQSAGALDWVLLNNDATQQTARVTVFQCPIGAVKSPAPPGPLEVTVDPGHATHNANQYAEGFIYEVVVECNSLLLFPYVSVWPGNFGVALPGTAINSASFLQMMPS